VPPWSGWCSGAEVGAVVGALIGVPIWFLRQPKTQDPETGFGPRFQTRNVAPARQHPLSGCNGTGTYGKPQHSGDESE